MNSQYLLISAFGFVSACVGDAQFMLAEPVARRCENAGLRDCDTLTHATLLYADGKASAGRRGLLAGLDSNADKPQELEQFAQGLERIGATSNGGEYQANLESAVWLVRYVAVRDAKRATTEGVQSESVATPSVELTATPALVASSSIPRSLRSISAPETPAQPSASAFFMLAGNALAAECRFPGAPKMLCLHESIETPRIVSDIIVSAACPHEVLFASRHGIDLDWVAYAPAGNGAAVHGAALPLIPGHTLTAGVSYASEEVAPDVRCGITVVWRDVLPEHLPPAPRQTKLE